MNSANREVYEANRSTYDDQIKALPGIFQERLIGFRNGSPNFWEYEPYEIFVCEEAVKIAASCPSEKEVDKLYKATYEEWTEIVPDISLDHSGLTFGTACSLAKTFLMRPDMIPIFHGAMCPLVGCIAYGCYAARKK